MGLPLLSLLGRQPVWRACGQAWRNSWRRLDGIAAKQTLSTEPLSELRAGIDDLRAALAEQEQALQGLRSDVADLHSLMAAPNADPAIPTPDSNARQPAAGRALGGAGAPQGLRGSSESAGNVVDLNLGRSIDDPGDIQSGATHTGGKSLLASLLRKRPLGMGGAGAGGQGLESQKKVRLFGEPKLAHLPAGFASGEPWEVSPNAVHKGLNGLDGLNQADRNTEEWRNRTAARGVDNLGLSLEFGESGRNNGGGLAEGLGGGRDMQVDLQPEALLRLTVLAERMQHVVRTLGKLDSTGSLLLDHQDGLNRLDRLLREHEARLAKLAAGAGEQSAEGGWEAGEGRGEEYDLHPLEAGGVPCGAVYCTLRVVDESEGEWQWYPPPRLGLEGDLTEAVDPEGMQLVVLDDAVHQVVPVDSPADQDPARAVAGARVGKAKEVGQQMMGGGQLKGDIQSLQDELCPALPIDWAGSHSAAPGVEEGPAGTLPSRATPARVTTTPQGSRAVVTDSAHLDTASGRNAALGDEQGGPPASPGVVVDAEECTLHRLNSGRAGSIADSVLDMALKAVDRWKDSSWPHISDREANDGQGSFPREASEPVCGSEGRAGSDADANGDVGYQCWGRQASRLSRVHLADCGNKHEGSISAQSGIGRHGPMPAHCSYVTNGQHTADLAQAAIPPEYAYCTTSSGPDGSVESRWPAHDSGSCCSQDEPRRSSVRFAAFENPLYVELTAGEAYQTIVDDDDDDSRWTGYPECGPVTPRVDPEDDSPIWYPVDNPLFTDLDMDDEGDNELENVDCKSNVHDRPIGSAIRAVSIHTVVAALGHARIEVGDGALGASSPRGAGMGVSMPDSLSSMDRWRGGCAHGRIVERP